MSSVILLKSEGKPMKNLKNFSFHLQTPKYTNQQTKTLHKEITKIVSRYGTQIVQCNVPQIVLK